MLELHGNNCFGAAALLGIVLAIGGPSPSPAAIFGYMFLVAFGVGVVLTNQCHKWAHEREHAAGWVKALMKTGIILSTRHHDSHHSGDHTQGYCITTGWLNRVLDPIRFFPRAERLIRAINPFCRKTPSWIAQAHLLPPGSVNVTDDGR
jgi:sterol desaturase/sphingolipid hydroxylase (fatty acid hydroxylase superfamily)